MKFLSLRHFVAITFVFIGAGVFAQRVTGTLPVMYINTEGGKSITSKEEYLTADCWVDPMNTDFEAVGSASNPVLLNIRGRGNWTWEGFEKKPYKLKFDKKQEMLGMKKSKHFALLAHADDELGFMRNTAGFELSRRLGLPWTPTQQPVEVVINGDYKGLYLLTENIRVDSDRVDIVEQKDEATDPEEITGGWLVEIDNYNTDPHVTVNDYTWHSGYGEIWITYKTPEVLSSVQEDYLQSRMQMLNDMFCSENKNDATWTQYVDLDQLVRYYIVQEILDDAESFHGSCFLYKDLGENEKWKFGPVWDFGNTYRRGDSRYFIYERPPYGQAWIGEIAKFPVFQRRLKEIWADFLAEGGQNLESYLRSFKNQIKTAALSDARRWPEYGNADIDYDLDTFTGLMQRRLEWLGDQWGTVYVVPEPDAELYLRGDFNSWSTSHPFEHGEDGLYYVTNVTTAVGEGRFKIADANWGELNFGSNGSKLYLGMPYQLQPGTNDNIYAADELIDVDFIMDLADLTLTVVPTGTAGVVQPEEKTALDVDGRWVRASGVIKVYDMQGRLLQQGTDSLHVDGSGMLIIVTQNNAVKIIF